MTIRALALPEGNEIQTPPPLLCVNLRSSADSTASLRQLWKNPGFTSVAVFTLALGIGANTVVMSWIRSTLLNSIPGAAEPSRLVVVAPVHPEAGVSDTMSLADIEALRGPGSPFERIAGSQIDVLGVREGPGLCGESPAEVTARRLGKMPTRSPVPAR
jgi:hypothetical protein